MKLLKEDIRILGLSSKEVKILNALRAGKSTPILISEHTKVSRPTIYEILARLHGRGLIKSNIMSGKKHWSQAKERDLEAELYSTKKQFFNIEDGVEEVRGLGDSLVTVHRGEKAVHKLLFDVIKENKEQRLYTIQGDKVVKGWNKIFGIEGTNEINRFIKKNRIITEIIVPYGWFERQTKLLGKKWAKDFEGRAAITHEIGEEYFKHGGQFFIFKSSLYLMAMNEEVVVEVRNSEIQELLLNMFRFIQDNSQKFDVNVHLQKLLQEKEAEV